MNKICILFYKRFHMWYKSRLKNIAQMLGEHEQNYLEVHLVTFRSNIPTFLLQTHAQFEGASYNNML